MKHYELMYIVPLKVSEDEGTEVQAKVREFLAREGAKITKEESLGKRKLAYSIAHVRHGLYVITEFDLEANKVAKLSEWFRLSPDVLRAQLIAKKLKTPEQLARERALQEKLMKKQLKAEEATHLEAAPVETKVPDVPKSPEELSALDKKLEEILKQEIVK